jgi:hypothetical protein
LVVEELPRDGQLGLDAVHAERGDLAADMMVLSYIESPSPPPTLPQMIWRPRCSMNPVIMPASPPTMTVPPFWSMRAG